MRFTSALRTIFLDAQALVLDCGCSAVGVLIWIIHNEEQQFSSDL